MKKDLRLSFRCFWPGFDPKRMPQDYFFKFVLSHGYNVIYDDINPDIVIYSVFAQPPSRRDYKNNPLFIAYSCEPYEAMGDADIYMGYGGDKYYRCPLWLFFMIWDKTILNTQYEILGNENIGQGSHHTPGYSMNYDNGGGNNPLFVSNMLNRHLSFKEKTKFCNFTYTNPVDSRIDFFIRLSRYKDVESTGSLLNNTGYRMISKSKELSNYKFTIAFENSILPGYVTEKLMEPLAAGSLPIYLGDDICKTDFNPKAFICVKDFKNFTKAIEYIKEVDNNDELYMSYMREPIFGENVDEVLSRPLQLFDKIHSELIKKRPELNLKE